MTSPDDRPPGQRHQDVDPDPGNTPGLEPGGGVPPGEIPPQEASTSESAGRTPAPRERGTPVALAVVIGVCVVIGLLIIVWGVLRAVSA